MKTQTLILVRHAHRDKPFGRQADNGLSSKGKRQAKSVLKFYRRRFDEDRPKLLSSPKKRCVETLIPLSRALKTKIETDPVFLEEEDGQELPIEASVSRFCAGWKKQAGPLTVVCSHGDWLPLALKELVGVSVSMRKGAWAEVERTGKKTTLCWLVQKPY